jgi:hypothetical protein
MHEYFGIGATNYIHNNSNSNNRDKFMEIAKHFAELGHDLENLIHVNTHEHLLMDICELVDKQKMDCDTLRPFVYSSLDTIDTVCRQNVTQRCLSDVYLNQLQRYEQDYSVCAARCCRLEERILVEEEETTRQREKIALQNAIEVSLRQEIKTFKLSQDHMNKQLVEANAALRQTENQLRLQKTGIKSLEQALSESNKELHHMKDCLARAESIIITLKEELQESTDTHKIFVKNNLSIMSVFPILQAELTNVMSTLDEACRTCTEHLPSSLTFNIGHGATDTHEAAQHRAVVHHMQHIRQLGLMDSDQQVILSVLETIIQLITSAYLFEIIGGKAISLQQANHVLRADIDRYQTHIERERKRYADVMHYAADMETFSKGLLQPSVSTSSSSASPSFMSSMLHTQADKERTQTAIIEAKDLWKREHEARMQEKEVFEAELDAFKETICKLEQTIATQTLAVQKMTNRHKYNINIGVQTDVVDCPTCRELSGKLLRANLELDRERGRICETCTKLSTELANTQNELKILRSSQARSQLIVDSMNSQMETLVRECEELRLKVAVRRPAVVGQATSSAENTVSSSTPMEIPSRPYTGSEKQFDANNTSTKSTSVTGSRAAEWLADTLSSDTVEFPALLSRQEARIKLFRGIDDPRDNVDYGGDDLIVDNQPHSNFLRRSSSAGDSDTSTRPDLFAQTSIEVDGVPQILGSKWKQLRLNFLTSRVPIASTSESLTTTKTAQDLPGGNKLAAHDPAVVLSKKPVSPVKPMPGSSAKSPLKSQRHKLPAASVGI